MSDAVLAAIIVGTANILAVLFSRLWSHREHKETAKDVKAIKQAMNGAIEEEV